MIKARAGRTLVLGLSEKNLQLLREGRPIQFSGSEFEHPQLNQWNFIIMYGEDEDAIMDDLLVLINPDDGGKKNVN
jgi:hypothetical protein